jgi:hypothetical protein
LGPFKPFRARFASKFAVSYNMSTSFFVQNSRRESQNAEIDADFEFVAKIAKNACKKVIKEKVNQK